MDTPLVAVIRNALSHLTHVGTKHDFACGLFRGLGANLDEVGRQGLAAEISKLMGEPNVLLGASQGDTAALLRYSQPFCSLDHWARLIVATCQSIKGFSRQACLHGFFDMQVTHPLGLSPDLLICMSR